MRSVTLVWIIFFCAAALAEGAEYALNEASSVSCETMLGPYTFDGTDVSVSLSSWVEPQHDMPAYCHIEGEIAETIGFAMRVPAHWNHKLVVAGCGGFCGAVIADKPGMSNSINAALKDGFAAITTDSGHQGKSWDTQWAIGNPELLRLFAGAWMPLTVTVAQNVLQTIRQKKPENTYFSGCSNGGRLGLYAAQHYPDLFDGIAAGGAIMDLSGNAGLHGLWLLQTTRDKSLQPVIDAQKLPFLAKQVLVQCDALDGLHDGIINQPQLCKPKLSHLQCDTENATDTCFTKSELNAIERLYQGAHVDGKQVFAGLPPGSEHLWAIWVTGDGESWGWGELAALGYLRIVYQLPPEQTLDFHHLDLEQEMARILAAGENLDATQTDLSDFAKSGGKLLYFHGLSDPLILPERAKQYAVEVLNTTPGVLSKQSTRFFMVPGHGHCWELPGHAPDEFNPVALIDQWVESGQAPNYLDVHQTTSESTRQRRICPFPQRTILVGKQKDSAESYQCQ
ncbi:tannase/feruloyl esterase family alpha/beta hydrolase [uncultured Thalassolituus sp.]|uniref:tannase/feruloyl esterase family alpha/beta hydrolase n=1 Tax=uncultured Thalassolituus sp. TaxID=285273 RepID=UPI0032B2BD29